MPPITPSLGDRLRGWRRRLLALLHPGSAEREMSTELAFHIDMETEQNIRRGMSPADARQAAVRAFGGVGRVSEEVRETRKVGWLDDIAMDLRHAARGFRRTPGFTLSAVAALSLGIGANAAVFSVVYAVVLAPLPFAESDRLVRLWERNPSQRIEDSPLSPGTFVDLRARSRTLERVALVTERDFLLTSDGDTWEATAASVSPAFFEMLGVRPILGSLFLSEKDAGAEGVGGAIISHDLWMRRFGGDPDVIGRTFQMDYRFSYTITGVMPAGFSFPAGASFWIPIVYGNTVPAGQRQLRYFPAIAQLRAGHTIEQANQELAAIASQLATEHPAAHAGWTFRLMPLHRSIVGDTRTTLLVLLGLAGCVLLVACGNVATLAVARATARSHETSVRVALGAGRTRLLRQWTTEGLLLALLGGTGGLLIGYWSTRLLVAAAPPGIPRLDEVRFDGAVLGFVALVAGATALLVGLAPALRMRDGRPLDALRSRAHAAGSVRMGTRDWLVGAQVALTMVLTVAAALLLRSFEQLQSTDLGYRRADILSAEVRVPVGRHPNPDRWFNALLFNERLIEDLRAIPGVRSIGGTTFLPLTGEPREGMIWLADAAGARGSAPPTLAADQWRVAYQIITPGYLETMGIPVVRGRPFEATDRFTREQMSAVEQVSAFDDARSRGVALINEAMAKRFWPNVDPIGQRIVMLQDRSSSRTIVGIIRDVRAASVAESAIPTFFVPLAQSGTADLSLVLRTDLPPAQLVGTVKDRLDAFDPAVSVASVRPMDDVVGRVLSRPRFTLLLVGSFAALALAIAAIGIFGIVAFLVTRRTHEIGIRMALGAHPRSVLLLVLRDGLKPVLLGAAVGCVGAIAVAHTMRALLYGIAPFDGVSFVTAAAVLVIAALVAAMIPAARAAGLDPLQSLRVE